MGKLWSIAASAGNQDTEHATVTSGQECPNTSAGGMVDKVVDKATSSDTVEPTVVTAADEEPALGVLGHIFKFLVHTNTWGKVDLPEPTAVETEEEEEVEE